MQAEIWLPSAVSRRVAKLAIRVPGGLRPDPQSPLWNGWVGHGAQVVAFAAADHLVIHAVVHLVALAVDQAGTVSRAVIDDIDFLSKRIIDVPKPFS